MTITSQRDLLLSGIDLILLPELLIKAFCILSRSSEKIQKRTKIFFCVKNKSHQRAGDFYFNYLIIKCCLFRRFSVKMFVVSQGVGFGHVLHVVAVLGRRINSIEF